MLVGSNGLLRFSKQVFARLVVVGKACLEFEDNRFRIEPYRRRVGANERAAKEARGPARHVVALKTLEESNIDLRTLGDRLEADLAPFALVAEPLSKTFVF